MANILNTGFVTSRSYGLSTWRATDLTNSAQEVKASEGNLWGWNIINPNGSDVYVKFYNADATVGTTTPIKTILVPANGTVGVTPKFLPQTEFDTKIEVAVTTGLADSDTTAPASTLTIDITYA